MKRQGIIILALISILSSHALAQENDFDILVINSWDWIDVYSGIMYANLVNKPYNFITSREQSTRLPTLISGDKIYLIESEKRPFVVGYKSILEGKGFSVEERTSVGGKTLNLELAGEIDTKNFIVVDDTYGYNAISLCPYAVASKSYVLFVDEENIEDVYSLLKNKEANILMYGHLNEKVIERLREFKTETIDYGDKFDNNIEIVRRYRQTTPVDQVTLTSGDFMELGLMKGSEPILLIGKDSVPEQVVDYIKTSGIKVGVLIGNELTGSAQSLKAQAGISVFLKFGQGSGAGAGSASIRDLDLYQLPSYPLNITAKEVAFNIHTSELEITYKNEVDTFTYFKSSIEVYAEDELIQTVGEKEPVLIDAREEQGSTYPLDLSGYDIKTVGLKANVFIQYGESKKSMERTLEKELNINLVEIEDLSDIEAGELSYDKDKGLLILEVKNKGPSCHVKPALTLTVDGDETIVSGDTGTYALEEKSTRDISFEIELSEGDLKANEKVRVEILYGERENFLINSITQDLALKVEGGGDLTPLIYPTIILLLLIVIAVLLMAPRRKRKVEEEEGEEEEDKKKGLRRD
jgi:hypothetical protein